MNENIEPAPILERAMAVVERVKLEDGNYVIKLPVTSAEQVIYDLETGETIHEIFNNALRAVLAESYTLLEDFATLVGKIAGLVDDNIDAHHIFRDNMKYDNLINLQNGRFQPGSISNGTEDKLVFSMKNPIVLKNKPVKFELKSINNIIGNINIKVRMTFNALDDEPIWIEYTDHYNNELFLPLTADVAARKQDGVDWAINFVFEAERLDPQSSIEVVDYIVLHL